MTVYVTSTKLTGLRDPDAAITWAREINNVSPKYRTPEVEAELIRKVNAGKLVNSKEVRALRRIVPQELALKEFLSESGTISSALNRLPAEKWVDHHFLKCQSQLRTRHGDRYPVVCCPTGAVLMGRPGNHAK